MHNVVRVAVVQSLEDLPEDFASHLLVEVLLLDDAVEELAARAQLTDQVNVDVVLEILVQLDNIRVIKLLQDFDFSLETVPVSNLGTRDDLDSPFLAVFSMSCCANLSVSSLTQLLLRSEIDFVNGPIILHNEGLLANQEVSVCRLNHVLCKRT